MALTPMLDVCIAYRAVQLWKRELQRQEDKMAKLNTSLTLHPFRSSLKASKLVPALPCATTRSISPWLFSPSVICIADGAGWHAPAVAR